jgi:hypothetical protein
MTHEQASLVLGNWEIGWLALDEVLPKGLAAQLIEELERRGYWHRWRDRRRPLSVATCIEVRE